MNQNIGQLPIAYYVNILRRQWRVTAGFTTLLFLIVLARSMTATRFYASTVTIEINNEAPIVLSNVTDVQPNTPFNHLDKYYRTQYWLAESRAVMDAAVAELREKHGITDFNNLSDPSGAFRGRLRYTPMSATHLLRITAEHPDPERAALFANTAAKAYVDVNLEHQLQASSSALEWLTNQQEVYRERRYQSDRELLSYQSEKGVFQVDHQNVTVETLERLQSKWSEVHAKRVSLEAQTRGLRAQLKTGQLLSLADHISTPGSVTEDILNNVQGVQQERASLLATVTEQHPEVLRKDREVVALKGELRKQVIAFIEGQEAGVALVRNEEEALAEAIEEIGALMASRTEELLPLRFLEQQAERDAKFFENLDTRRTEVALQRLLQANNIRIVDLARPGSAPVRPTVAFNLLSAVLIGIFGGSLLGIGIELTDTTVKTREDVEAAAGAPLLGFVPLVGEAQLRSIPREVDRHLYSYAMPRSPMAECLRTVRTNLLFRGERAGQRRYMITSASPREGKSFLSSNLASTLASLGGRVLLIDADLRRPALHARFGLSNQVGVSDVLLGHIPFEEAIQETHIPGVHVIPGGPSPEKPLELLGGSGLEELMNKASSFDTIIIDTPPANVVSDAFLIGAIVEGVIFIVSANKTTKSLVASCCTRLQEVNSNLLGIIVNKLDVQTAGYGYDYYYSDYYQYYQSPTRPRVAETDA